MNNLSAVFNIVCSDLINSYALKSQIGRVNDLLGQLPIDGMNHAGRGGGREFVEPVGGMDDHGAFDSEVEERLGHGDDEFVFVHADELVIRAGGVGQRADGVEDRRHAEGFAGRHCVFDGGVVIDGKAEAHACIVEALRLGFNRRIDIDAKGHQDFCRAAAGA